MTPSTSAAPRGLLLLLAFVLFLTGCAGTPAERDPDDPLERYNRAMFTFNDAVDRAVVRPAAKGYETVTPQFVRTGVGNFFGNVNDVWHGFNNILQGKVGDGMSDWMRFMVNSTFGLLGVLDVASEMGLPKHDEDFGQTLAVWGVGEGPFVVLPFLGPRTLRHAVGSPADRYGEADFYVDHVPTRNSLIALRLIHQRSTFLGADRAFEEAAMDKYTYMRDFYLQRRRYKVYDGDPPLEYEDWDDYDDISGVLYPTEQDRVARLATSSLELTDAPPAGGIAAAGVTR